MMLEHVLYVRYDFHDNDFAFPEVLTIEEEQFLKGYCGVEAEDERVFHEWGVRPTRLQSKNDNPQ
jgi:hypothetical protein